MDESTNDSSPVRNTKVYAGRNPVITRDISEDRLLQVSDDNVTLKRHLHKQEDRIRQLATKLVRVISDKSKRNKRDEILIEDQKLRIEELESQVSNMRSKLSVARQQLGSYTKLVPGVPRHARPKSSRSSTGTPTGKLLIPDQVTRLLLDAKGENHVLKDQVKHLNDRLSKANEELVSLRERLKLKESEYQDELIAVRSHTQTETEKKQKKIAENIQLIRLQRDSKRTASWLATYEAQCRTLEVNFNSATENVSQLELQLSTLQQELRDEQAKSLNLLRQVEESLSYANQLKEVNAQIIALQDENKILKETNATFLAKSLESCQRMKKIDIEETTLKSQIDQLEATIKSELKAKSELISSLTQEKTKCLSMEQATQVLNSKIITLSSQLLATTEELTTAKKIFANSKPEVIVEKQFITQPCENCLIKETDCNRFQQQVTQLKLEIGKTKELLKTQININKEYQEEIEALTSQLTSLEVLHQKERKELMEVFTEKTSKMAELEQNLESLRQRRSRVPPQAFIVYENFPLAPAPNETVAVVDEAETQEPMTVNEGNEVQPDVSVENSVIDEVEPNSTISSELCTATDLNSNGVPESDQATIFVRIQRFIPLHDEGLLSGLFVTWEHENLPRQYSPIVSDGIFNSESVHELNSTVRLGKLIVQLHQAVGQSDALTLAMGYIEPGTDSTPLIGVENGEVIGSLSYNYKLTNFKIPEEANNTEALEIVPEVVRAPVPVPRKLKLTQEAIIEMEPLQPIPLQTHLAEVQMIEPSITESSEALPKGNRKSILRRESSLNSPKLGKRRVRVNEKIEERKYETDSEGQVSGITDWFDEPGQAESSEISSTSKSIGQIQVQDEKNSVDNGDAYQLSDDANTITEQDQLSDEPSVVDSMSEKRRARRKFKRQIVTEDTDEASDCETSRNISDIESTMSGEETVYPDSDMTIEIYYAKFNNHAHILNNPSVKKFFIEYQFLNYPAKELESEISLPKPLPGRKAQFDFLKTFFIDTLEKQRLLKEMLTTNTQLRFTLVTEPGDNDTIDCEDIGYSYVSLSNILSSGNDITKKELPVYDAENSDLQIGVLCVTVQAFKTLNSL